ncbi:MAG: type II and III secretion system protein [Chthoniobacterales bacterium]|nr:type II and III secretion system protein [Chthoniobacterales bacterium]
MATRKQHKWVAEYLFKVDRPQDLIAIEVKFLETKKNPQYDFGINWQNMLGTGITVRGSANAGIGGEYGFGFDRGKEWGSSNFSSSSGGNSILSAISNAVINNRTNLTVQQIMNDAALNSLSGNSSSTNFSGSGSRTFNTDFRGQNTTIPYEAVLSLDEFSVTLQAFMQDRDTSIVQYPRVLTLNNKEVAITSAENTPLNVGTGAAVSSTGTAGTTVGQLGYLPTGTQINILPKVVNNKQIAMTVAITVSSVVGTLPINLGTGVNLYPITTERVYNASLQVDSGFTLAVGGLEKVDDSNVQGGVPVLKDIPGLGYFFKNKNKARNKVNLIIFITPYLIGDPAKTPGISETPQSIVPQRPGGIPQAPTFTPDGVLSGGATEVANAFAWLEFQLRYFRQVNMESLITLDSIQKLRDVIGVARALLADLQSAAGLPPYDPETEVGRNAIRAEEILVDLNRTLAAAQENLM